MACQQLTKKLLLSAERTQSHACNSLIVLVAGRVSNVERERERERSADNQIQFNNRKEAIVICSYFWQLI
jgi:hypothetical protein